VFGLGGASLGQQNPFGVGDYALEPTEIRLAVFVSATADLPWGSAKEAASFMRRVDESNKNHAVLEFAPITVDGQDAFRYAESSLATASDGSEVSQTKVVVIVVVNGLTYGLTGGSLSDTYQSHKAVIDRFISSFRFISPPPSPS
jgi:hypothetical protein